MENQELIKKCEMEAQKWLSPSFDEATRKEVQAMLDNPELAEELEQKIMAAILGSPQTPEPDDDSEMMRD